MNILAIYKRVSNFEAFWTLSGMMERRSILREQGFLLLEKEVLCCQGFIWMFKSWIIGGKVTLNEGIQ